MGDSMATRTEQAAEVTLASKYKGLKHETIHYTEIATETITPGSKSIVYAAFEGDDIGDLVTVAPTSTSTVGAVATGGPHTGTLHIWSKGY